MCGIIGCVDNTDAEGVVVQGLKNLEYRGYDSWGIVAVDTNDTFLNTRSLYEIERPYPQLKIKSALGHTRWATHGQANIKNAHPIKINGLLYIVHNGTVPNAKTLIQDSWRECRTSTDTEIIGKLIHELIIYVMNQEGLSHNNIHDILQATQLARNVILDKMDEDLPDNVFLFMVRDMPDTIFCLTLGQGEVFVSKDGYICSDHNALAGISTSGDYYGGHNGAFAFRKGYILEFSPYLHETYHDYADSIERVEIEDNIVVSKLKHNFVNDGIMYNEIAEQQNTEFDFELRAKLTHRENFYLYNLHLLGCGSSYYAGMFGKKVLESVCDMQPYLHYASDVNSYPFKNDTVLAISQSGETYDVLKAIRSVDDRTSVYGVTANIHSRLAREVSCIGLKLSQERAVAATKTFFSTCLFFLNLAFELKSEVTCFEEESYQELIDKHRYKFRISVSNIISDKHRIRHFGFLLKDAKHMLFLGQNTTYPIALEGALKMKEVAYIHSEGMLASEMKHGPIALIEENTPCIFVLGQDYDESIISNMSELRARGGKIVVVCPKSSVSQLQQYAHYLISVPDIDYFTDNNMNKFLQALITAIPLQILAASIAVDNGYNPDRPRNLAKTVTV